MPSRTTFLSGRYLNYARGLFICIFLNLAGFTALVIMYQNLHIVPEITSRVFSLVMWCISVCFSLAIIGPNLPEVFSTNTERDEEEQKKHDTAVNLVGFGLACGLPVFAALIIMCVYSIKF